MLTKKKLTLSLTTLSLALSLGVVVSSPFSEVKAQNSPWQTDSDSIKGRLRVAFEPPPGQDAPKNTAGGGTRGGSCSTDTATGSNPPLTLLLPATKTGLTLKEHPTFMVYVPPTEATEAEFTIRDVEEKYAYRTEVALNNAGGVVSIELPKDLPPLEVGKDYMWSVAIICSQSDRLQDAVAQGYIRRTQGSSSLTRQLENATAISRPELYGKAGIWFDTVTALAELRRSQPNNPALASSWQELLKSDTVQLQAIAEASLVD